MDGRIPVPRRSLGALAAIWLCALAGCGGLGNGAGAPTATPIVLGSRTPTAQATPPISASPSGTPATSASSTPTVEGTPSGSASPTSPLPSASSTPASTPTPGSGASILPDIVETGRVVFRSQSGETCCVAVDPALLVANPAPGQPTLVLTDLPPGPATVTVSGYVQDFAPAPADATATCNTLNTTGVASCDLSRLASPAYESPPEPVTIISGVRINLGDVDIEALPFLLDFTPPQDGQAQSPVAMRFTVVDADTGIAGPSVALDVTFDAAQPPLTQRLPLTLVPCADGGATPCSGAANLGVSGFKAQATLDYPPSLPAGAVTARITAQNLVVPPHSLDFTYRFTAVPQPTATATPSPTLTPTFTSPPTPTPTVSSTATATHTATRVPTATTSPTATETGTPIPTRTPRPTAVDTATFTPTQTRTFTETPTPTPTTLCEATPRNSCRNAPSADLRLKVAASGDSLDWRWLSGNAPLDEFGDPTTTTTYALCLYDSVEHVPKLVFAAQVEPGGFCGRSACWSTVGSPPIGYRFIDSDGVQYGMEKLLLRDRTAARDSIIAQGGGPHLKLPLPVGVDQFLAQQDNVIVQLVNDAAGCWQTNFRPGDVTSNTSVLYEAAR